MTICERIFAMLNSQNGKSATGLCKYLGINTSVATNWKQRNTDPPAKYIIPICEYLDASILYILSGAESAIPTSTPISVPEINAEEMRILEKYRTLDEDGRDAVRGVLLNEQRRVADSAENRRSGKIVALLDWKTKHGV